jgi:hypothetical protein
MTEFEEETLTYSKVILGFLLCLSMCLLLLDVLRIVTHEGHLPFPIQVKFLLLFLILWGLFVISRGFSADIVKLKLLFGVSSFAWAWLVPAAMVIGANASVWKQLNRVFIAHTYIGVIAVCFAIINLSKLSIYESSHAGASLATLYATGFLLMTWHEQAKNVRFISIISVLLMGAGAALMASRHTLVIIAYNLISAGGMYIAYFQGRVRRINAVIKLAFASIFLIILITVLSNCTWSYFLDMRIAHFREKLQSQHSDRMLLWQDFVEETSVSDAVVGKGVFGTYEGWAYEWMEGDDRMNIECGYLQIVLKGGIVMLALFLALTVPAAILGIFYSNNFLGRVCGLVVLGRLVDMFPYGVPEADISYVFFWLAVGACWNKNLRRLPDFSFADYSCK